jgi:hypothetical protein
MRRLRALFYLLFLGIAPASFGQGGPVSLQLGLPIEKSLPAGQTHSYSINLEKDQFAQIAVEKRGVEIVLRMYAPDGKLLREFEGSNGSDGTEYAEIVVDTRGTYRVDVSSVDEADNSVPGKYEIKFAELRKATPEELQTRKNENARKGKGLALLIEASQNFDQFRLPETRVAMQLRAAQLLWQSDEKKASNLLAQATETVRQMIGENANREIEYEDYQLAMRLRLEVIHVLATHDPDAALKFLQSTRMSHDLINQSGQEPELQLESSLASQIASTDPKRAFELAEDMLRQKCSNLLTEILSRLTAKEPELAGRLAHDIAKKIEEQDLVKNTEAAYLSSNLLQAVHSKPVEESGNGKQQRRLLSNEDFRDLLLKVLADLLSYSPPEQNTYTTETAAARNLATAIRQIVPDVKTYAPDRADAIEKKIIEVLGASEVPGQQWQAYQTRVTNEPIETALESVQQAPAFMRDTLYQQVANRVASSGDVPAAQRILTEKISNPNQRKQALYALRQEAVTSALEKGHFEEALLLLSNFPPSQRTGLVNQLIEQIGPNVRKSRALQCLEQARNLVTTSVRAEDDEQLSTLLAFARAFAPHDANRSFQIAEPIIDQFNEISAAAMTMNRFGQEYYREGELVMTHENPVVRAAHELSDTLATLAMFDFDRAKRAADRVNRPDVRLRILLEIAQRTMEIIIDSDEYDGYNS